MIEVFQVTVDVSEDASGSEQKTTVAAWRSDREGPYKIVGSVGGYDPSIVSEVVPLIPLYPLDVVVSPIESAGGLTLLECAKIWISNYQENAPGRVLLENLIEQLTMKEVENAYRIKTKECIEQIRKQVLRVLDRSVYETWKSSPLMEFSGLTANDLMNSGRHEELLEYVNTYIEPIFS